MGFTRMRIPFDEGDPNREEIYEAWQAANLMGQSLRVATNHVWHAIPNAFRADDFPYKQAFEDNPEMYALVDGKRKPPQFCVTNEELQAIVIDYTQRFFKHNPEAEMVSLDPADGPGWCECKPCSEKFARPGDQAFFLADMAARKLQETHPGKYVGILAYSWHSEPPDFDLAPNVFVQLTAGMNSTELSFEDLLTGWSKRSEKMGIYEYFTYWEMDRGMPPGKGPQNRIDDLANRLKNYIENNVINITAEAGNSWGAHGLGYYIASRLMWNPKADLSALKNDFYETAFGPAASAMERYFERMNLSNNPFQGRILLRQSLDDLEDALRLAKGDPEALKRVEDMATLLIYSDLGQRVENSRDDAEKEALALEWFRWAYRIRNSYMVDWATFRAAVGNHTYARTLAAEFNRPDWNYRHTDENPWRDTTPITSEEIASRLAKLREEWGDTPQLADPKFQGQPVLVTVDGNGPRHTKHWFTAAAQYALASKEGEPLRFTLTSNPTPGVERQPARYFLTDLSGEVIHRGIFPLGENSVELEVPGPGIYLFTCRRGGRGWVMDFPDTLQGAILPNRDDDFRPNNLTTYFYVPKGEKEIVLYVESGSALVRDAEGTVVHQGQAIGDLVFIPVPDGTDGAVWSLRGKMRNLWFLNIPTMLSVDPTMVFVPQDLAEKDGLPVVVATPGLSQ